MMMTFSMMTQDLLIAGYFVSDPPCIALNPPHRCAGLQITLLVHERLGAGISRRASIVPGYLTPTAFPGLIAYLEAMTTQVDNPMSLCHLGAPLRYIQQPLSSGVPILHPMGEFWQMDGTFSCISLRCLVT
jgi:hypothetical protein